jgi:hypothetical protein
MDNGLLIYGNKIKATSINVEDYQKIKDLHGISLVDEMISELLSTIQPKNN